MDINYLRSLANDKLRFITTTNKSIELSVSKNIDNFFESNSKTCKIDMVCDSKRIEKVIDYDRSQIDSSIDRLMVLSEYKTTKFFDKFSDVIECKYKKIIDKGLCNLDLDYFVSLSKDILSYNKEIYKIDGVKSVSTNLEYSNSNDHYIAKDFFYSEDCVSLDFSTHISVKSFSESSHSISKELFKLEELNLSKYFDELKSKIILERNPKDASKLDISKYDLIFSPECFANIIDMFIIDLISIEEFKNNSNYLTRIKSLNDSLNISENPHIDYSSYSANYDSDFILSRKQDIVKNGEIVLEFVDLYDSYKYNVAPSGNSRSNLVTNLFVKPSEKSFEKLVCETKKGIIINDFMGSHTTSTSTGELNVTCTGLEVIDGNVCSSMKNISLNVNVLDLLKNIELSKEISRYSNYNCPYLFSRRN